MSGYTTRDVAELLDVPATRIRTLARSGMLSPARGSRGEYRFSFQDIVLLRTAKELVGAKISPRRVWRAIRDLKEKLPQGQTLSGVRIVADGDCLVVRDEHSRWQPESGQTTFDFSVAELAARAAPLVHEAARRAEQETTASSDDWYNVGVDLELVNALDKAKEAYRRAAELNPRNAEAHVNLGRLLHTEGELVAAESHYREAVAAAPADATAIFNLGVVLEDLGRAADAIGAYEQALAVDPGFADAHYNLAHLHEVAGNPTAAIRHLARYRSLVGHGAGSANSG